MRTREEDRQERERFYGDAVYEAYRSGMNCDRIDRDNCDRAYWDGRDPESVVNDLRRQDRKQREAQEYLRWQEYEQDLE